MARTFGKMLCSLWTDADWLGLSPNAKVLFSAFFSQPDISAAGVLTIAERRWRKWIDGTAESLEAAIGELVAKRYVVLDEDTDECWVRSFIKHDGRLENANLGKSVVTAIGEIRSETISTAVSRQYPDIAPPRTPSERPSDALSNADANGVRREVELLDLDLPLETEPSPEPSTEPTPCDITPEHIAQVAGGAYARIEAQEGRARDEPGLAAWKTTQLLESSRAELERFAAWNANHRAWSGHDMPLTVLAAAALGDTHSLAHYPETGALRSDSNVVDMPARKLNGDERLAALQAAGAPVRLTGKHTETPL